RHMWKEEQVLFPFIREFAGLHARGGDRRRFEMMEYTIRMMEREHADAGDALHTIRELTSGYATPPDGCRTYAMAMAELRQFEDDLHRHVHLENNMLFPAALGIT